MPLAGPTEGEKVRKVCATCKHLIAEQPHVCPSEEYLTRRNRLFNAAMEAEEIFSLDDLEHAASELKEEDL
jgi:hypothetical protein